MQILMGLSIIYTKLCDVMHRKTNSKSAKDKALGNKNKTTHDLVLSI